MNSRRSLVGAFSAFALAAALVSMPIARADGPPPASAGSGPRQIVADSAQRMLTELSAHRALYAKNPAKLDHLVATVLLPNFDTQYAAQLVLGPAWRTATPEQRTRFVSAFYHSLLSNYGAALVDFTANRFKILPYHASPGAKEATVRTVVLRENGDKVAVDFRLHQTPTGWKAWDVVIEGISYVQSFRTQFASEVDQKGLQEVIERLERQNAATAASPAGERDDKGRRR